MINCRQKQALLSSSLFLTLAFGCAPGSVDGKYAISGSVLLDGQPLEAGTISFVHEQRQGRPAATMFFDGVYNIPAAKGLKPGRYVVRIESVVASPQTKDSDANGLMVSDDGVFRNTKPAEQLIPAEYNTQSKLIAEVTSDGPNQFDFSINTE